MENFSVIFIYGGSGFGKSVLAKKIADQMPSRMVILEPRDLRIAFTYCPDWSNCDCLAIDELWQWERRSLQERLKALQVEAAQLDKTLILIGVEEDDLRHLGIDLMDAPLVIECLGPFLSTNRSEYYARTVGLLPPVHINISSMSTDEEKVEIGRKITQRWHKEIEGVDFMAQKIASNIKSATRSSKRSSKLK